MFRSLLFVPAKEKMLKKIESLESDAYIIDLEDSVEDEMKAEALERVKQFLESADSCENIYIRVNKDNYEREVKELAKYLDIGFMLPKIEKTDFYEACSEILNEHPVIALIETPLGVVNTSEIAQCVWVDGIAFGAEDFSASVNMKKENELLRYPKGHIITHAKAYKKKVYDTPSFHLGLGRDFEVDVIESVELGFDGKLAISPKHISFINQAFNRMDNQEIINIITQYENEGKAVQVIGGKVYEKMHIECLKKIVNTRISK